ncbi:hypothetical protein FOCC_FOCC002483 [Frankliniella occidentalis]|nr:hypothetical protein FOCC_FOCC002483 [Frankliniella occidentalis]
MRGNATDACEEHDPCQHGGICISTDSGPICECRNVDYEGTYCEKDKAPPEATFRGTEYLSYDLSRTGGEPIVSTQDTVSLSFKTRSPNGLLFYTGEGADYLNLALKDGGVILSMNLSNGRVELSVKPNRVRFDDNAWHTVVVHRRVQVISTVTTFCHVTMNVDGVYTDRSHTAGSVTILASSRVFVGGSDDTAALPGSRQDSNFVGCLRKVEFSADSMRLSLIEMARTGQKLISVVGRLDFQCQEVGAGEPVTFTTPESFLMLPNWDAPRSGSLSLKLRTNEPNGLVIYSHGANSSHVSKTVHFLFISHRQNLIYLEQLKTC